MDQTSAAPDLRYPIGRFQPPPAIDSAVRSEWIDQIAELPAQLRRAIDGLSDSRLDTPYRPGGWTVRQVVHHLADSHINSYVRFKLALTEPEPPIKPYEEGLWAELDEARTAPPDVSLTLLAALHRRWVLMLRAMSESDFSRAFRHPERGVQRLDTALGIYAWHGRHHVAHITSLREREGW
jgi:DinB superfamily